MFNLFATQKKFITPENWHEEFIPLLARLLQPKIYVELGLYHCELFNKVFPFADKLIGIDTDIASQSYMKKSKKTFFYHMTTQEYARELKKNPINIDLLFIDANHRAREVLKDFDAFFPFVREQGIILLHDTYPKSKKYIKDAYCSNAFEAAQTLAKKTKQYEVFTLPIHPGLSLIRKRKKQLAWLNEK